MIVYFISFFPESLCLMYRNATATWMLLLYSWTFTEINNIEGKKIIELYLVKDADRLKNFQWDYQNPNWSASGYSLIQQTFNYLSWA